MSELPDTTEAVATALHNKLDDLAQTHWDGPDDPNHDCDIPDDDDIDVAKQAIAADRQELAKQGWSVQPVSNAVKAAAWDDVQAELHRYRGQHKRFVNDRIDGFLDGVGAAIGYSDASLAKHQARMEGTEQ